MWQTGFQPEAIAPSSAGVGGQTGLVVCRDILISTSNPLKLSAKYFLSVKSEESK